MRPPEVDDDAIVAAGKALLSEGRTVTGFALRKRIGGGSASRLHQVWAEYVAGAAPSTEPMSELPVEVAEELSKVSAELAERLARLAVELNDKAVKAAARRVAEVVREGGEQRKQAERELADASTTVEELEGALSSANDEVVRLRAEVAARVDELQNQAVQLGKVEQQLVDERRHSAAIEADLQAAKNSSLDVATLQGRLAAVMEQNELLLTRLEARHGTGNGDVTPS